MSDANPNPVAPFDAGDFMKRWEAHAKRAAELHPGNKAALFTALAGAGISRVAVRFDGFGDSGQIEHVQAFAGEAAVDLPTTPIEIANLEDFQDAPSIRTEPVPEAIETLAYAFLELTHAGWENNEGAFGEFTFDVTAGTIALDYNERFESSENHTHEF